jgi:hypothetical protein
MSLRRTPAPDIAACVLLLFAATLFFSVLRSIYGTAAVGTAVAGALIYGGLLSICALTARGIFLRRPWAMPAGVVLLLVGLAAALASFHVPETAELPAGLLGLLGTALLVGSRGEFAAPDQA